MPLKKIHSIKRIEQLYRTGEEPVLVMCSDVNTYVCKYMRSSASAYKLACEFIGARMAMAWRLTTPDIAIVQINPAHWKDINLSHSISAPAIGSKWLEGVVDITPSTYAEVPTDIDTLKQLMRIALFDFWIANEDRNANNANLMYDVVHRQLISIDYGCILNTATFEFPLSQLTSTDTILWSDLFLHIAKHKAKNIIINNATLLKEEYAECIEQSKTLAKQLIEEIPSEWHVPSNLVKEKLNQLFDENWINEVWINFTECLKENIQHE